MPPLPPTKTVAKWVAAWVASNLAWTLLSGAVGALVSGLLKGLDVLDNAYALVGIGLLVAAAVASLPALMGRRHGKVPRLRVATAPKSLRVPLMTAPPMQVDEGEAKGIAITLHNREARVPAPIVPEAHRDELKELAATYSTTVGYRRPARGKQHARLEQSFWTHFPDAGKLLEKWDVALEKHEGSEAAFRQWLNTQDQALLFASNAVMRAIESGANLFWKVDSGYLWLDGGLGIAPVTDDANAEALKRPYEALLTRARATPKAATLRATLAELLAVEQAARAELERITMLKVIRGKCELC